MFYIKTTEERQSSNSVNLERIQRYSLAYSSLLDVYYDTVFITHNTYTRNNFQNLILEALKSRDKNDPDQPNQAFETQFAKLYTVAFDNFFTLDNSIRSNNFEQAEKDWARFSPGFEEIKTLLEKREKNLRDNQTEFQSEVNRTVLISVGLLAAVTFCSLLMVVFVLGLISRVLILPLNQLNQALKQMSLGDLNQKLVILNRDEIGELAANFGAALGTIHQILKGVQISGNLGTVTTQLTVVSQEQAVISNQQVTALAQVLSSIEELAQTAGQISNIAAQVATLTTVTEQQIEVVSKVGYTSQRSTVQIAEAITQSLSGIAQIEQQVKTVHEKMDLLVQQSNSIGKVVELLNSVAGEVHLLALNASIEAASSGGGLRSTF